MYIQRTIQAQISKQLFKGKVIIIYGARRTGKTTLVKNLISNTEVESTYINCDLIQYQSTLNTTNTELLKEFIGDKKLIVLDEAQQIGNIGHVLKILIDTFPHIQFIATGSSSFELSGKVNEPLTGRSREYMLFPFSIQEINSTIDIISIQSQLDILLRFGSYPQVFESIGEEKIEELNNIASNYLYKDMLRFESIKKPELILNLLKAIALQLGSESSYNELAQITGTNVHTIKRYLDLLEKSFIIFRLKSFSRNLRNEINKSQKIYFYDTGIRNSLLQNYSSSNSRTDIGGLWENFCIAERLKFNYNNRRFVNMYFWRTYDQKEIDYIEEKDGHLTCFEFKYNSRKKVKIPKKFVEQYPNSTFKTITPENLYEIKK